MLNYFLDIHNSENNIFGKYQLAQISELIGRMSLYFHYGGLCFRQGCNRLLINMYKKS